MKSKLLLIIWISMLSTIAVGEELQFGLPYHGQPKAGHLIDEIALVINDEAISRNTLEAEMNAERAYLPPNIPLTGALLKRQLLDRVIINHILQQVQKRANVSVSDRELNAALDRIAKQNRLNEKELFAQVKRTTGMSQEGYRQQIRRQMIEDRLKQIILSGKINITEAQINDQIAQIARQKGSKLHVYDMLIPLPEGTPETRAKKIEELITNISNELRQHGQDLQAVAAQIPQARFKDFGEVNLKDISPKFADVLANTNAGEIADTPIIDQNGMHFLKVVNKKGGEGSYQVEEAKVSHILLRTGTGRDDQTQKLRAEQIYHELLNHGDFQTLARKYSEDPQSAARGGDLGWVSPEDMVSEFAQAMKNQKIGQIYPPIKTPYGYHLIIVHERKISDKSEDLLRQKIRHSLYARAVEDAWEEELQNLREEAYVDIRY